MLFVILRHGTLSTVLCDHNVRTVPPSPTRTERVRYERFVHPREADQVQQAPHFSLDWIDDNLYRVIYRENKSRCSSMCFMAACSLSNESAVARPNKLFNVPCSHLLGSNDGSRIISTRSESTKENRSEKSCHATRSTCKQKTSRATKILDTKKRLLLPW